MKLGSSAAAAKHKRIPRQPRDPSSKPFRPLFTPHRPYSMKPHDTETPTVLHGALVLVGSMTPYDP